MNAIISKYFIPKIKILRNALLLRTKNLVFNSKPLIIFELTFKFFSQSLFLPLIWLCITSIAKLIGYEYITDDNIWQVLCNPFFVLTLICFLLIICYFSFVDISAAIFTFECSRQKKKTSMKDICKFSFKNAFRIFLPKNLAFVPFVLFVFPLLNIGTTSSLIKELEIKTFLTNIIKINPFISLIMILAIGLAIFFIFRWMFVFQYFTLENINFRNATKKSNNLLRGNRIRNIISVIIVQVFIAATNWLMNFLVSNIGKLTLTVFGNKSIIAAIGISILFILFYIIYLILLGFFMPISCWRISMLYYDNKKISNEKIKELNYTQAKIKKIFTKKRIIIFSIITFFVLMFTSITFYSVLSGQNKLSINNKKNTITCATQSFNNEVPDYSLASINKAKDLGSKMINQSLQVTKDMKFVSFRKDTIYSNNGESLKISDTNYDEIKNQTDLNILNFIETNITSSEKTKEYIQNIANIDQYVREIDEQIDIPLVEDIVNRSKEQDITLILDLSSFEDNNEIFNNCIDKLQSLNCFDKVHIISSNYQVLQKIKEKYPFICTIYKLSIAIGNLSIYKDADILAVDGINITKQQIMEYHKINKKVIAWDIRSKDKLKQTIECDVDIVSTFLVKDCVKIVEENAHPEVISIIYNLIDNSN